MLENKSMLTHACKLNHDTNTNFNALLASVTTVVLANSRKQSQLLFFPFNCIKENDHFYLQLIASVYTRNSESNKLSGRYLWKKMSNYCFEMNWITVWQIIYLKCIMMVRLFLYIYPKAYPTQRVMNWIIVKRRWKTIFTSI